MKIKGWDLDFFNSGEWQVVDERLKDLEKRHRPLYDGYNPGREKLFAALRSTSYAEVNVCIIGQDPYPSSRHATGLAFSIPNTIERSDWPPTLTTLLKEYATDLARPIPSEGSLDRWAERGVLLWNAIPSCATGRGLSHDWAGDEWGYLTREIVKQLSMKGIVFALLGNVAGRSASCINTLDNHVIRTSHPSPRGSHNTHHPFVGSRLFSTINDKLNDLARGPIDWTL